MTGNFSLLPTKKDWLVSIPCAVFGTTTFMITVFIYHELIVAGGPYKPQVDEVVNYWLSITTLTPLNVTFTFLGLLTICLIASKYLDYKYTVSPYGKLVLKHIKKGDNP